MTAHAHCPTCGWPAKKNPWKGSGPCTDKVFHGEAAEGFEQMGLLTEPKPDDVRREGVREGARRRDAAIARVAHNGEPTAKLELMESVRRVALSQPDLLGDDVWWDYQQRGIEGPHEPRLLGPVMRAAATAGYIVPTDEFRLSARPEAHRNPKRVWRSQLYGNTGVA